MAYKLSWAQYHKIRETVSSRLAVIVDVDETITEVISQNFFAEQLGYREEQSELECALQAGDITSRVFSALMTPLMRRYGLTEQIAIDIADTVPLRQGAEELLLRKDVDLYFASTGPSFFVRWLAAQHDIPQHRVLCSEYTFFHQEDGSGLISDECCAVSSSDKKIFVRPVVALYQTVFGLGDHQDKDGEFLDLCHHGFLTVNPGRFGFMPEIADFERELNRVLDLRQDYFMRRSLVVA